MLSNGDEGDVTLNLNHCTAEAHLNIVSQFMSVTSATLRHLVIRRVIVVIVFATGCRYF